MLVMITYVLIFTDFPFENTLKSLVGSFIFFSFLFLPSILRKTAGLSDQMPQFSPDGQVPETRDL